MSAAEMAAESAAHGEPVGSAASSAYASDARDHELSNGVSDGAVAPLDAPESGPQAPRRVRTENEQQLIARGRLLLHTYQQKRREKRDTMQEICFSETSALSAVEVLADVHKADSNGVRRHYRGYSDDSGVVVHSPRFAAAAASVDSEENWLAPSVAQESAQRHSVNEQLLDAMEMQLEQLWTALGDRVDDEPVIESAREALSRLLQQGRIADASVSSASHHGEDAHVKGRDRTASGTKRTVEDLQAELVEAKALISELNDKVNGYRAQLLTFSSKAPSSQRDSDGANGYAHSSSDADAEIKKLRVRVQEKEELLLSLRTSLEHVIQDHGKLDKELSTARATIERLEGEKEQMRKAASDKRTLLHRAYIVKAKQLDQLCKEVELPSTWERVTDENGIIYYRQNDRACAPELEDPRVPIAVQRLPSTRSGSISPRSAGGRMQQTIHGARTSDRKYSSSSFDSTVSCEDIAIPPEDGTKHEVNDFETPLPEGWEMRVTTGGAVFFVNRNTNVTTWKDPRRMKRGSSMVKRSSAPHGLTASAQLSIEIPERRASIGAPPLSEPSGKELRSFDVVFEEKGPIGIHFQANTPDAGATVRRLLPRMAASRSQKIEPFDRLIAVNKNPVDNAPFRYVMLLLQGGLRPLTLTFERGAKPRSSEETSNEATSGEHLDEEVVLDGGDRRGRDAVSGRTDSVDSIEPTADSLVHRTRRSTSSSYSSASDVGSLSSEPHEEDFSIADKIITNVFSLFWTPPDQPRGQVETV